MQFEPTETQIMLAQSAARLAESGQSGAELASQLDEMGFRGIMVPEDAGGFGGSMADAAALLEEFGRGDLGDTSVLNAVICAPLLIAAGQSELAQALIDGTRHVALALYEAGRGYHSAPLAVGFQNGTVTGDKVAVIGGDSASDFIVTALDAAGELVLCLVSATAAGVNRRSYAIPDGRGAANLGFQDATAEVLDLAAGADLAAALDRATLGIACEAQGVMAAALDITLEHLKTRQQFGRPLSKFQVLQAQFADMTIAVQQARSGLLAALDAMDADAEARAAAVSAAKVLADKAALMTGEGAVQLHGAIGITEEHRIGQLFRRLTSGQALYGDRRHHLARFSEITDRPETAQ